MQRDNHGVDSISGHNFMPSNALPKSVEKRNFLSGGYPNGIAYHS
jgi:hypothetical protein